MNLNLINLPLVVTIPSTANLANEISIFVNEIIIFASEITMFAGEIYTFAGSIGEIYIFPREKITIFARENHHGTPRDTARF